MSYSRVILIIFLMAVIIGVGCFLYLQNHDNQLISSSESIKSVSSSPATVVSEDYASEVSTTGASNITFSISSHTLQVLRDNESIQKFVLSADDVAVLKMVPTAKEFLTDYDVNFDGYKDVGVFTGIGYGGVNIFYNFYLYTPNVPGFEKSDVLTSITEPSVDPVKKEIKSTYKSGPGYETVTYQWNSSTYITSEPKKDI